MHDAPVADVAPITSRPSPEGGRPSSHSTFFRRFALALLLAGVGMGVSRLGGGPALLGRLLWRHQSQARRRVPPPPVIRVPGRELADPAWRRTFFATTLPRLRAAGLRGVVVDLPTRPGEIAEEGRDLWWRRRGEAIVPPMDDPMRLPEDASSLLGRVLAGLGRSGGQGARWMDYRWVLPRLEAVEIDGAAEDWRGRVLVLGEGEPLNRVLTPVGALPPLDVLAHGLASVLGGGAPRPLSPGVRLVALLLWGLAMAGLAARPSLGPRGRLCLLGAGLAMPLLVAERLVVTARLLDPLPFCLVALLPLLAPPVLFRSGGRGGRDERAPAGETASEETPRGEAEVSLFALDAGELLALARRRGEAGDLRGALEAFAWLRLHGELDGETRERVAELEGALEGDLAFMGPEELGGLLDERFVDPVLLGQGAMGVVLRCRDEILRRDVAVKLLAPSLFEDGRIRERFFREVRALARLHHPGVVEILSVHGEGGTGAPHYAMALVEGPSLADEMDRRGRLPRPEVSRILRGLAEALAHVHGQGLSHRDVKADNVMLDAGRPVLIDFGVARALDDRPLTRLGEAVGTLSTMAPELLEGRAVAAADMARCDVFSFAVLAWTLRAGRPPFPSPLAVARGPRLPEGERDGADFELLRPCLDRDPAARPSMEEILRRWDEFSSNSGGEDGS